jgi:hypothetical protein
MSNLRVPSEIRQKANYLRDLQTLSGSSRRLGSSELLSLAAEQHGQLRRQQGYSASMLVEESRMLQVSIFETLKKT